MSTGDHVRAEFEHLLGLAHAHHKSFVENIMSKLQDLAAALDRLIPAHQAVTAERDDLKAKLEAANATIAQDEADAGAALDKVNAELSAEQPADPSNFTPSGNLPGGLPASV